MDYRVNPDWEDHGERRGRRQPNDRHRDWDGEKLTPIWGGHKIIVMKHLFLVVLLFPLLSLGAEISSGDASRAAAAWVRRGYAMGKLPADRPVAGVDTLEVPETGAVLRVVRFEGGGYVVCSADNRVEPVLAFSETGEGLSVDEESPFWALLCADISAREAAVGVDRGTPFGKSAPRTVVSSEAQRKWAALLAPDPAPTPKAVQGVSGISEVRVDSFVESQWGQTSYNNYSGDRACFNACTPNNCPCGCTATVLAQIMRYWKHPSSAVAAHSYNCAVSGASVVKKMMGGTYDWDSMPLKPAKLSDITDAQCQAIGKLTYDAGVTLLMNWNSGGSSASLFAGVAALTIDFGYANAKGVRFSNGYDPDLFRRAVIPNLDARCPCGLSVSGAGGHAALVDGYGFSDGDFFIHVNMGWVGRDDAWYAPPKLATSSYAFNAVDGFLFNIFPGKTGSVASGRVLDADGAPVAGATVVLSDGQTVRTDDHGIYAFVASPGSYVATASADGISASADISLGATSGTFIYTTDELRGYCSSGTGTIGNSGGNDIVLSDSAMVDAPVFSPDSCRFYPSTNVVIACPDASAAIRYTLDGSTPTESSPLYSRPIAVTGTVTIKARAFAAGKSPSIVVTAVYTYDESLPGPPGDFFDNPIDLSGPSGSHVIGDISVYSLEDGEPLHTLENHSAYQQACTVWFRWTAPGSGTATFQTSASGDWYVFQTCVAAYVGDSLASATRLAFATPGGDWVASLPLSVTQGTTYRIVGIMGNNSEAKFTLKWDSSLVHESGSYETWASRHGLGDPDEKTGGVANAFRYAFGIPSGSFSPISGITFDGEGHPILHFPPLANTEGIALKVVSSTNLVASGEVPERALDVDSTGAMRLDDAGPVRFYGLKAEVE